MSTKIKLYLGRKVLDSLSTKSTVTATQLKNLIQIGNTPSDNTIELNFPLNALENQFGMSHINRMLKIEPDDIIKNIQCIKDKTNRKLSFEIDRNIFVKEVIENVSYPDATTKPKNIVVEYSSPNIAKPFHMGHLRSTIIGNFIANLHNHLSHRVTRINYLGDWGTQFGFIKVGLQELNYSNEVIKSNPIKLLYESYVHANKLAEKNPDVIERARQEFTKLEKGSEKDLNNWKLFMEYTKNELEEIYERLGVKFDVFNYESMYSAKDIKNVIEYLQKKNIVQRDNEGKHYAVVNDRNVTVLKSDGTSLYLTRDIAAAIDRFEKYKFDKMYYVVDNAQTDHFNALRSILFKMDHTWSDRIRHIKFGRIRGMSSRKGTSVFLKDILDECRDLMIKKQIESPNTKVPISDTDISDILGVSCVIINDLKRSRQKDYKFDWQQVLQAQGDTGIKLQYTHCRLCSLEENCGVMPAAKCDPKILEQTEVTILVRELSRFQDVLYQAEEQLEACVLVNYLFHLCNHISRALKILQVKGEDPVVSSQRLLLFNAAREVLSKGMCILGLKPLKKM